MFPDILQFLRDQYSMDTMLNANKYFKKVNNNNNNNININYAFRANSR